MNYKEEIMSLMCARQLYHVRAHAKLLGTHTQNTSTLALRVFT